MMEIWKYKIGSLYLCSFWNESTSDIFLFLKSSPGKFVIFTYMPTLEL